LHNFVAARKSFEKAIELDPDNSIAREGLKLVVEKIIK